MRLIHTTTLELTNDLVEQRIPPYAILSHCWGDREVTLQEFQQANDKTIVSFSKIRQCCRLARSKGLDYAWVDTCCIDKTSSAELSEAINSMFEWYRNAECCFVLLSDADDGDISHCRWFTRGWTLQELLAPKECFFYDSALKFLGTRKDLVSVITDTTGIPAQVFRQGANITDELKNFSVAQIMSWASGRETTRVEDTAYCLLGLFNVNMPLLYGERHKAFRRLQEHIIAQSDDESIFAWGFEQILSGRGSKLNEKAEYGVLAATPAYFKDSRHIERAHCAPWQRGPYAITNKGLEIQHFFITDVLKSWTNSETLLDLPLHCQLVKPGHSSEQVAVVLRKLGDGTWCRAEPQLHFSSDTPGSFEFISNRISAESGVLHVRVEMGATSSHEIPVFQGTRVGIGYRFRRFVNEWAFAWAYGHIIFDLARRLTIAMNLDIWNYVTYFALLAMSIDGNIFRLRDNGMKYAIIWLTWFACGLQGFAIGYLEQNCGSPNDSTRYCTLLETMSGHCLQIVALLALIGTIFQRDF